MMSSTQTLQSLLVCVSKVLAAPPRGDRSAQEAETPEHCAVPGLRQPGRFHQDLHGGSTGRCDAQRAKDACSCLQTLPVLLILL